MEKSSKKKRVAKNVISAFLEGRIAQVHREYRRKNSPIRKEIDKLPAGSTLYLDENGLPMCFFTE